MTNMVKPWGAIGLLSLLLLITLASGLENYIRPPPRKIVTTHHTSSDSHPQQVHISAVGKDRMRVTYVTDDWHVPSVVEYGKAPGKYEATATGESTFYRYFFYKSGKIHHVEIGPLEPDMFYYYRCGGTGGEFKLKTAPAALPIEFAVIGDLGQTEWTASTLAHVNQSNYDMLLLPGDLSYADTHQPLWDTFGRFVQPYASARPWMVTEGNHEIEALPILKCHAFAAYNARWPGPSGDAGGGSGSNLYYSFNAAGGTVHVVMLGSYTDFDANSEQYRWAEADLRKVDRGRTPWMVVLLHAPWYNTNLAHHGEGEAMRTAMEKLLFNARVDVVFAGHVHAYERFKRIYDNAANPCGPVYITIGDGGNREGLALDFDESQESAPLSLFREASFGHGRLRVLNATHAKWSWHRNDDAQSVIRDEVVLRSLSSSRQCMPSQSAGGVPSSPHSSRDEL